jgi:hypothetical protein
VLGDEAGVIRMLARPRGDRSVPRLDRGLGLVDLVAGEHDLASGP